jgi:type II secretory pathway component PulK
MTVQWKMRRIRKTEGDERGTALLLVVFLVAFSSLLVGTFLRSLAADLQITNNLLSSTKALHVAEAGVEHAIASLRADSGWSDGLDQVDFPAGSGDSYTVTVNNQVPAVVVTSTGIVNGFVRRLEVRLFVAGATAPHLLRVLYWKEI